MNLLNSSLLALAGGLFHDVDSEWNVRIVVNLTNTFSISVVGFFIAFNTFKSAEVDTGTRAFWACVFNSETLLTGNIKSVLATEIVTSPVDTL